MKTVDWVVQDLGKFVSINHKLTPFTYKSNDNIFSTNHDQINLKGLFNLESDSNTTIKNDDFL